MIMYNPHGRIKALPREHRLLKHIVYTLNNKKAQNLEPTTVKKCFSGLCFGPEIEQKIEHYKNNNVLFAMEKEAI